MYHVYLLVYILTIRKMNKKLLNLFQNILPCYSTNHNNFIESNTMNDKVNNTSPLDTQSTVAFDSLKHLEMNIKNYPPDIYITNEKGRIIKYIMCV